MHSKNNFERMSNRRKSKDVGELTINRQFFTAKFKVFYYTVTKNNPNHQIKSTKLSTIIPSNKTSIAEILN